MSSSSSTAVVAAAVLQKELISSQLSNVVPSPRHDLLPLPSLFKSNKEYEDSDEFVDDESGFSYHPFL